MSRATLIVIALILAFAAGTASAGYALTNWLKLAGQHSGPWQRLSMLGTANADPYSRAFEHLSRQLPMGGAEGQIYAALKDDNNQPLDFKCDYRVEGDIPAVRLFTLHAETLGGQWIEAKAPLPSAVHSDQMLFYSGTFAINVGVAVQPENWLALGASGPFALVLTYYDVAVINDDTGNATSLPRIKKGSCFNG